MENREIMKLEALNRMEKHHLLKICLLEFEHEDVLYCSDYPALRVLTDEEKKMVKKYEEESNCLVYHIIHSFSPNIGETYELLRVSNYIEDWEYENQSLEKGQILVRAENITTPNFSESGSILVENYCGVLVRIA